MCLSSELLIEDNPGGARLIRETLKDIKDFRFTLEHVDLLAEGLKRPQAAISHGFNMASNGQNLSIVDNYVPAAAGISTPQLWPQRLRRPFVEGSII